MKTFVTTAPCGCVRTITMDESEDYDGYDTDREQKDYHWCSVHQAERNVLIQKQQDVRNELARLFEQERELHQAEQSFFHSVFSM